MNTTTTYTVRIGKRNNLSSVVAVFKDCTLEQAKEQMKDVLLVPNEMFRMFDANNIEVAKMKRKL